MRMKCARKNTENDGRPANDAFAMFTEDSPSTEDQVILRFYKNEEAVEANKEIGREQISISAQNFCGLSLAYRYSKNPYVLTVICLDFVILLSFESHGELLNWYHKIQNTLPSAAEFQTRVIVPNQPSKINPGQAILHFYDNHFALTPAIPKELLGSWSLASLQKYTFVGDSVFFSSTTSKGEKTFVLVTKDITVAENLKNHFDLATSVRPPSQGGQQSAAPEPSHGSSNKINAGDAGNHNSSNGVGGSTPGRDHEDYSMYDLPPPPPPPPPLLPDSAPVSRTQSCGSPFSSFGSRQQYDDYVKMQSHDPLEPTTSEPATNDLLRRISPLRSASINLPLQDGPTLGGSVSRANSEDVFAFWEPATPQGHQVQVADEAAGQTTFLYECMPEADLKASVAREQNYEVMNTFDHIRRMTQRTWNSEGRPPNRVSGTNGLSFREGPPRRVLSGGGSKGSSWEESSYMNLFTRKTAGSDIVPPPPIFVPHPIGEGSSPTAFPPPPPPALPTNHTGGPGTFTDCSPADVRVAVPIPFNHSDLVQPWGPIAMLALKNSSGQTGSGASPPNSVPIIKGSPSSSASPKSALTLPWGRTNSCPANSDIWRTLQPQRKYSMPPQSGNLLADTRQSATSCNKEEQPPELPPRVPQQEPFLPSGPPPYIRQRCYTDSALKMGSPSDSEQQYLLMRPTHKDQLSKAYHRSHSVTNSPIDVAIPTSPLGSMSRVYNNRGLSDTRTASPSLVRSNRGHGGRYLKRSATVATSLTRKGNGISSLPGGHDSSTGGRRGSMPLSGQAHSPPRRSYSTASAGHLARPRTSRDYASIDPAAVVRKATAIRSSSNNNVLASGDLSPFSDTSGSGVDMSQSSSSLSDLSSQASNSRASSFGSQTGVGLLYPRRRMSADLKEEGAQNGFNGSR